MTEAKTRIGVIGGSGLYQMPGFERSDEIRVDTPFGDPSDAYIVGYMDGVELVFLPRHGRGHRVPPTRVNYQANIFGFKTLGCNRILSFSAVGSMKESYPPGHVVLVDQFIDRTAGQRPRSFFEDDGLVAHIGFADPVCKEVHVALGEATTKADVEHTQGGTYICIEGPQFSTRAESHLFRSWGVDVIGMTNLPEARLAREAEICYATVALVTDYDCWHEEEEDVTVEAILEVLKENTIRAQRTLKEAVRTIPLERGCGCGSAMRFAIVTDPARIPTQKKKDLEPLIGRYLNAAGGTS